MKNLLIISGALLFIITAYSLSLKNTPPTNNNPIMSQGITKARTIDANLKTSAHDINILFIGNSYTFFNDIPGMMLQIAKNDPQNKFNISLQSVTFGGARLQDHWNNKNTHKIIESRQWDMIILQEQSQWALFSNTIKNTAFYINKFTKKAAAQKSYVMLYQTWPRQPGSKWYNDPEHKNATKSVEYMMKTIKENTANIAYQNKILYAPIGEYWYKSLQQHPEINLYAPDGTHPSISGSYLAALVFYKYLTGNAPRNTSYIPKGIPQKQGETIKHITSEKL